MTIGSFLKLLDQVWDGESFEFDSLYYLVDFEKVEVYVNGVKEGSVPEEAVHVSHTSDGFVDGDVTDIEFTIFLFYFLELSLLLGNDFSKLLFERD